MNKIEVNPKDSPTNPKSHSSLKPQPTNQPKKIGEKGQESTCVNMIKANDPSMDDSVVTEYIILYDEYFVQYPSIHISWKNIFLLGLIIK